MHMCLPSRCLSAQVVRCTGEITVSFVGTAGAHHLSGGAAIPSSAHGLLAGGSAQSGPPLGDPTFGRRLCSSLF